MKRKLVKIFIYLIVIYSAICLINYIGWNFLILPSLKNGNFDNELALTNKITIEQFKILYGALHSYKEDHGYYLKDTSKYFIDSLIHYIQCDRAYTFRDSITKNNDTIAINCFEGFKENKNLYIGVGLHSNNIQYRYYRTKNIDTFYLFRKGQILLDGTREKDLYY